MRLVNSRWLTHSYRNWVTGSNCARGEVIDRSFDPKTTYAYQLEAFLAATQGKESNLTDAEDGLKQMQLIDAVYARGGLRPRGEGETHIGQSV